MLAIAAVVGVILLVTRLDDRIATPDEVETVAGLGTLGSIPRMKSDEGRAEIYRLATLLYPRSPAAEAYRMLRANVEFASVDRPPRTLLVTSSVPREGKTVTAANLSVAFAQAGHRVLLVDADLRKPGIHSIFDLQNLQGLTTLLRSDEISLDAIARPTEQANLRVLTTGPLPPNPAELLGSRRMRVVLERLCATADLVVFDSPPLQAVTDSAVLSSLVDVTLLVIDVGRSRQRAVKPAREALARAGANVPGAVLNRVPIRSQDYGVYYGDAYTTTEKADRAAQKPGPPIELPGSSADARRPG